MAAGNVEIVQAVQKCENYEYGHGFLNILNKMRINRKFCDISLDVDGEVVYVHKLALAVASPYFAAMFENDMNKNTQTSIILKNVEVIALKALVKYIYNGVIILTEDNVEGLLRTSDLLQIEWVKEQCVHFLKRSLNLTNCFRIQRFSDAHSCKELYDFTHKYILDHFSDLLDKEELLLLPFEKIQELINNEQHSIEFAENAYKALINWIKHDVKNRKIHLAELVSQIRLSLVSTKFLSTHVVTDTLFREDNKCNQFLIEALNSHLTKIDERKCLCETETKQRNETFYAFLIGGSNVEHMCKVYNISGNYITPISNMKKPKCKNSAIYLNGIIYSIGGFTGAGMKTAECYDPINKRWTDIASTNNPHWDFGICTYNDLVYVIGGEGNSSIESYCSATNEWYLCRDMSTRNHISTRSTLARNTIYSMSRGYEGITLCTRFDPREGLWCNLNQVKESSGFELVSYDYALFTIGLYKCERLDIRMTNRWETMPAMCSNRYGFSAVVAGDTIYVLGGRGKSKFVKSVERFSISNNKWTIVNTKEMEHYLGGVAIVSDRYDDF